LAAFKPEGIFPALITPFKKGREVDEEALRRLVNWVIERGVHGVVPCGTTGEFVYMKEEERKRVVETVVDEVNGRVSVIAGTGASATNMAVRLTRHAEDAGADAVLVVTPYYLRPADKGAYQHFYEVAKSTDLPIILYNIPQCTGGFLAREVVEDLAELENVVALKDSSGHLPYTLELLDMVGDRISILCGHDEVVMPALVAGASGAILASANVIPDVWIEVYEAVKRGDLARARELQMRVQKLARIIVRHGGAVAVKAALNMMGLKVGKARRPLVSGGVLSWEIREEMRLELEKLGKLKAEEEAPESKKFLEELGLSPSELRCLSLEIGEASAGVGEEEVHVRAVVGPKDGPVGYAWAKAFSQLEPGHEALLALLEPNLMARPPTLIIPTVEIRNMRQASMVYGPVQAAVGRAVQDAVEVGWVPMEAMETHVALVEVTVKPEALDRRALYFNAYEATREALRRALRRG